MSKIKNFIIKIFHLKGIHNIWTVWYVNKFLSGSSPKKFEKKRKLLNSVSNFNIGKGTKIVGPIICTGKLIVGENCWLGKNLFVNGIGEVVIGDNCDIAPEVTFQTGGHEIGDSERRAGKGLIMHQKIGQGTWIGGRSTIIGNTTIGKGCVIAGCSCVTKSFGDNLLIGGVPAKIIRELDDDKECNKKV